MAQIFHSERLEGVHPKLVEVVHAAVSASVFDVCVTEGVRSLAKQTELFAHGRTVPGPIITWTMRSQHLTQADGFGHAVDLCAISHGVLEYGKADALAKEMLAAGKACGVKLRWGGDWDGDGVAHEKGESDGPHFELGREGV